MTSSAHFDKEVIVRGWHDEGRAGVQGWVWAIYEGGQETRSSSKRMFRYVTGQCEPTRPQTSSSLFSDWFINLKWPRVRDASALKVQRASNAFIDCLTSVFSRSPSWSGWLVSVTDCDHYLKATLYGYWLRGISGEATLLWMAIPRCFHKAQHG
jgi:hypothetical protein